MLATRSTTSAAKKSWKARRRRIGNDGSVATGHRNSSTAASSGTDAHEPMNLATSSPPQPASNAQEHSTHQAAQNAIAGRDQRARKFPKENAIGIVIGRGGRTAADPVKKPARMSGSRSQPVAAHM